MIGRVLALMLAGVLPAAGQPATSAPPEWEPTGAPPYPATCNQSDTKAAAIHCGSVGTRYSVIRPFQTACHWLSTYQPTSPSLGTTIPSRSR